MHIRILNTVIPLASIVAVDTERALVYLHGGHVINEHLDREVFLEAIAPYYEWLEAQWLLALQERRLWLRTLARAASPFAEAQSLQATSLHSRVV